MWLIFLELFIIIIIFKQFYTMKHSVHFNNISIDKKKNSSTSIMAINHQNPLRFLYYICFTLYLYISLVENWRKFHLPSSGYSFSRSF